MWSFGWELRGAVYSAAKVPLLLAGSTVIVVPFAYVMNSALGLRDDFARALRGMFAAQATLTFALAALAPIVLMLYTAVPA